MAAQSSITGKFVSETVDFSAIVSAIESCDDDFRREDREVETFSMDRSAFERFRADVQPGGEGSVWDCIRCGINASDFGDRVAEREAGESARWVRLYIEESQEVPGIGYVGVCERCLREYSGE